MRQFFIISIIIISSLVYLTIILLDIMDNGYDTKYSELDGFIIIALVIFGILFSSHISKMLKEFSNVPNKPNNNYNEKSKWLKVLNNDNPNNNE